MAAIPITDWGDQVYLSFPVEIRPQFTVDARPFADMVDAFYEFIEPRFALGADIPLGLFRYYCMLLWWFRSLWLHKSNGNVLSTEEKDFLDILSCFQDLQIPSHIAQYLGNMGNFQAGDEIFYFKQLPSLLCSFEDDKMVVKRGWFGANGTAGHATTEEFWRYTQQPCPGVFTTYVCNEANKSFGSPVENLTLDRVAPAIDGQKAHPTHNIIGWSNTAHSRAQYWRATYSQLGWSASGIPSDCQTVFNVSISTLAWVSKRLCMLKGYSGYPMRQLTISTQGSAIQCSYLATDETDNDQRPKIVHMKNTIMNASQNSAFSVSSCFPLEPSTLLASFCFGYRILRNRVLSKRNKDGTLVWHYRSNYQPWLFTRGGPPHGAETYSDLPDAWLTNMNQTFEFGSQEILNRTRFLTSQRTRPTYKLSTLFLMDGANE